MNNNETVNIEKTILDLEKEFSKTILTLRTIITGCEPNLYTQRQQLIESTKKNLSRILCELDAIYNELPYDDDSEVSNSVCDCRNILTRLISKGDF